jgi:Flp pilus assembly protein TadB
VSPLPAEALLAASSAAAAAALALPTPRLLPARREVRRTPRHGPRPLRSMATVAVTLGAMVFVGGPWGVPVGLVGGGVCWWVTGRMEPPAVRRRRERLVAAVPHAVDLMAACLSVGLSPASAVEQVAQAVDPPLAEELAAVCARLRLGVDPVAVWRDLSRHPQLGGLGRALARAVESGASVADAMLRLSDDLRGRARAGVESRARAVGVKAAVPLGTCLLPAFVLVGVVPLVAGSVSVLLG